MQPGKAEYPLFKRTPWKEMKRLGMLGLGVLVKIGRIVIIFVLIVLSYPVLELMIEYGRTHSDAYHMARQFAVTNAEVLQVTGPVSTVRIDNRFNFHFCSNQADYTMDLTGEKANAILQIQVKYGEETWDVLEAVLITESHEAIPIQQTTTWDSDSDSTEIYPFLWKNACYATSFPPRLSGRFD